MKNLIEDYYKLQERTARREYTNGFTFGFIAVQNIRFFDRNVKFEKEPRISAELNDSFFMRGYFAGWAAAVAVDTGNSNALTSSDLVQITALAVKQKSIERSVPICGNVS